MINKTGENKINTDSDSIISITRLTIGISLGNNLNVIINIILPNIDE